MCCRKKNGNDGGRTAAWKAPGLMSTLQRNRSSLETKKFGRVASAAVGGYDVPLRGRLGNTLNWLHAGYNHLEFNQKAKGVSLTAWPPSWNLLGTLPEPAKTAYALQAEEAESSAVQLASLHSCCHLGAGPRSFSTPRSEGIGRRRRGRSGVVWLW